MLLAFPDHPTDLMKQWYYSESNEQRGPITEPELRQLIDSKAIPPATLVWSEGMPQWTSASSLPAFAPSPYAAPSSEPDLQVDWSGYVPTGSQVRPWIRYWARTLDFLLFSLVFGIMLGLIYPQFLEMPDTLVGVILLAAYTFVEPVMLSTFGTTPLKALLNIRVRNADGSRLSYPKALARNLKIWIKGEGLGIPLLSLFTLISSYNHLTNHGITTWDREGSFEVKHRNVEWWRWLLAIAFIIGFVALMVQEDEA